ncbi:spore coat protein D [Pallidibacillus pasinlerensis]|uniref:Spore coat protein D n=1 Tax=Pallidibacillus pasinlerensis TaxID=2703818 RepID=A0ABX0A813_9BACI|nr:spore coat protein D [Pallidibacillus pasinlerensis]NCU17272.1 spore coat protein D [Pallidibacillus pasinlerensis]
MFHSRPVYCPPRYHVRNKFVKRVHPVIHPIVHVNRINVIDVPRHIIKPIYRTEVIHHRRRCRWC